MLYTIGLHTRYVYVCTCMMSVSDHPACVPSLCGACNGRYDVCMRCCERSGLLGVWGCGPVSSPVIVPVRCLRAVNKVESSLLPVALLRSPSGLSADALPAFSPLQMIHLLPRCRTR